MTDENSVDSSPQPARLRSGSVVSVDIYITSTHGDDYMVRIADNNFILKESLIKRVVSQPIEPGDKVRWTVDGGPGYRTGMFVDYLRKSERVVVEDDNGVEHVVELSDLSLSDPAKPKG